MKKAVVCRKCGYFVLLKAKTEVLPLCVADAIWVSGPIRERIDVAGVVKAEEKNIFNDCESFKRFVGVDTLRLKKFISSGFDVAGLEDYAKRDELIKKRILTKSFEEGIVDEEYPEYKEDEESKEESTEEEESVRDFEDSGSENTDREYSDETKSSDNSIGEFVDGEGNN